MRRKGAVLIFVVLCGACSLPAAGVRANVLDDVEAGFGRLFARQAELSEGVWRGPSSTAALGLIAADLFALRSRDFTYEVRVLDNYQINAYSLPGGHIYVLRGLLAHAANIDEVAGVLAHEMGHQEDADFRRLAARQLMWLGIAGLVRHERGDTAAGAAALVGVLNSLRHSRRQEAQADGQSVEYCLETGYDPAGMSSFLSRIKRGDTGWLETIFATHPESAGRLALVAERRHAALAGHPAQAWHLCRSLAARGRPVTAYYLCSNLASQPAHRWWAEGEARSLRPAFEAARAVDVSLPQPSTPPVALRRSLDAVRDDGHIRWALEVAQVLAQDPTDPRYLSTLGLALLALERLGRAMNAGYEASYRVACAPEAVSPADLDRTVSSFGRLRRGGVLIAAVLGELLAAGSNRPLGGLSGARTGLLWAQAQWAFTEISAGQSAADALLARVTLALCRRNLGELTRLLAVWPDATAATLRSVAAPVPPSEGDQDTLASWRSRLQEATPSPENTTAGKTLARPAEVEDIYLVTRLAVSQLAAEARAARTAVDAANR